MTLRAALEKIATWPKGDPDYVKADAWRQIAIAALVPCGECHLQPGETCNICGRRANGELKDEKQEG